MATDKTTLKSWFKNKLKPVQEQFWAWMDSYWHKNDQIPTSSIQNLDNLLANTATTEEFSNLENTVTFSIANKVDKVVGKQLSAEDFTALLKEKLEGINMNAKLDKGNYAGTGNDLFNYIQLINGNVPEAGNSLEKIYNLVTGITNADKEYSDIAFRDADKASLKNGESVIVNDATADPTVVAGWAIYRFNKTTQTFLKLAEQESIDVAINTKVDVSAIANNLTTVTEGKVLDARQGKVLKSLIDNIPVFDIESKANGMTIDIARTGKLEAPELLNAFDLSVKFLEDFDYDIELIGEGVSAYPEFTLRNAKENVFGRKSKDISVMTKNGIRYTTVHGFDYIRYPGVEQRGEYCYYGMSVRFRDTMVGSNVGGLGPGMSGSETNNGGFISVSPVDATNDNSHTLLIIKYFAPYEGQAWDLSKISIYPYWKRALATAKEMAEYNAWYGVEWDSASGSPDCKRIGNIHHHQELPIQSRMRRCLLWDNGVVHYYLDANNSNIKEDGTAAVLDGTDGQVMVEVPEFYYSHELDGTKHRYKISEHKITGYKRIKKFYISAYEASLQRSTNKLSSVISTDPDYRGGNNTSSWDGGVNSLLGKPATNKTRGEFRIAASNRGTKWHQQTAYEYYPLSMLFVIEYATFNSQKAIDPILENGMKKGGLGTGATIANSAEWNAFNSYNPVSSCGPTNSLGNKSGERGRVVADFGGVGIDKTFNINSYRGVENPFGHIWKFMDGLNVNEHAAYATDDISSLADDTANGYEMIGVTPATNGYQTDIQDHLLPLPKLVGGESTTHLCDYYYQATGWRVALVGGSLYNGSNAGLFFLYVSDSSSNRNASIGARLCLRDE